MTDEAVQAPLNPIEVQIQELRQEIDEFREQAQQLLCEAAELEAFVRALENSLYVQELGD